MMHDKNTNFVIAVLSNGKVLREVNSTVFLPFNSEYSIRVKNPTSNRVGVSVSIDGTEINTHKIIVQPHSHIELKRMCIDGDLNSGPALKFVPINHEGVQDPTNNENGILKVSFYREIVKPVWCNAIYRKGFIDKGVMRGSGHFDGGNAVYGSYISTHYSEGASPSASSENINVHNMSTTSDSVLGATIPGMNTVQKFTTVDIDLESTPCSIMQLTLRGRKNEPLYSHVIQYCGNCGKKINRKNKFCSNCGNKIYYCCEDF
jgi:hypothetical protein